MVKLRIERGSSKTLLSHTLQNIHKVEIFKRQPNANVIQRFANVELRIGNHDQSGKGAVRLTDNPLVRVHVGGDLDPEPAIIELERPADGRYLTLQIVAQSVLDVGELTVYNE